MTHVHGGGWYEQRVSLMEPAELILDAIRCFLRERTDIDALPPDAAEELWERILNTGMLEELFPAHDDRG